MSFTAGRFVHSRKAMGNTLTKSPQELALATTRSTEKQRQLIFEPASPPPPPGYLRIHFYSHLYRIYDRSPPDMSADIVLCRSGGLDLNTVRRQWGLETCLPVDPLRWKPFHPTHPNYLSPVAIQVLSQDHGCIKFIEPTVSHQTLMQRQMREVILGVAALVQLICLRAFEMFSQCLEADTPFPRLYRRLRLHVKQVQQISLAWKWEEVFNVVILAIWVTLVVALLGGYIHIAPRERARNWVRTGSLSL